LNEAIETSEKKRKLEEDIKTAEARSQMLLENAARTDIEAYKKQLLSRKMALAERQV
jgi:hypothetical protein